VDPAIDETVFGKVPCAPRRPLPFSRYANGEADCGHDGEDDRDPYPTIDRTRGR
jgi:hypothetical protein